MNLSPKNLIYLLFFALPVVIVDQLSKVWSLKLKGNVPITVIEGFFDLRYAENRGALWGLGNNLSEFYRKFIFVGLSSAITAFIFYLLMDKKNSKTMNIAYSLVLGGAIGNLYDRAFRGFVIDFISNHYKDFYTWPTYNVADAAIVVAVALLVITQLPFSKKDEG